MNANYTMLTGTTQLNGGGVPPVPQIYNVFNDYYGDLAMRLVRYDGEWKLYGSRIESGLNEYRYLYAVVHASEAPFEADTSLSRLRWASLQTRTTDEYHAHLPVHSLTLNDFKKGVLGQTLTVKGRTKEETEYYVEGLPISVKLMHIMKKRNSMQYPDKVLLYQALETYHCVVEKF